jgi:hypothetical protein
MNYKFGKLCHILISLKLQHKSTFGFCGKMYTTGYKWGGHVDLSAYERISLQKRRIEVFKMVK